ncbi:MAG: hypothetical protein ACR2FY_23570 [Pirellulaceae bacterium]
MSRQFPENRHYQELADEHRQWLKSYDSRYLDNWEKLLKDNHEAALYEAAVRRNLQANGILVEPNESLTGDRRCPDFRCVLGARHFYVEVSCIPASKAEEKTGVPADRPGFYPWSPFRLIESVLSKCGNKYGQFQNLDGPALLAVGTLHGFAAMDLKRKEVVASVLAGKTKMAWDIGSGEASSVYHLTDFEDASFLERDPASDGITNKNSPISGILLGGVDCPFLGVLNPKPVHSFDPAILSDVEFGEVIIDDHVGEVQVNWSRQSGI